MKVCVIDGKKFIWDGNEYGEEKAQRVSDDYRKNNFETRLIKDKGKNLVYTRRVVKEIDLGNNPI